MDEDGPEETLVTIQTDEEIPPGIRGYRCVYCNCEFYTSHLGEGKCTCDIAVCPNADCAAHAG